VTNFLSIGQGVSILQGVEFWYSPLTKAVTVNTVLRDHSLPRHTEFRAEPQNLPVVAECLMFSRNFAEFGTGQ